MSFARANPLRSSPLAEINITPLVDVLLTVLIIFMITAPIVTKKIPLPLLGGDTVKPVEPHVLGVTITDAGEILLNELPTSVAELEMHVRIAAAGSAPVRLDIRPQAHSEYAALVDVLALATRHAVTDVRVEALREP